MFEEDNFENGFIDLEEEIKAYESEIYDKYFLDEDISEIRKLIKLYDGNLMKAKKAYIGMLPIGFSLNSKQYNQRLEIRREKEHYFENIVREYL